MTVLDGWRNAMGTARLTSSCGVLLALAGLGVGCSSTKRDGGLNVARAWENPPPRERREPSVPQVTPQPVSDSTPPRRHSAVIAMAEGKPITRDSIVELLLRGHGVGVLEQIIVLEAAKEEVAARGLTVTEGDVAAEYDRALRRLLSPLPADESVPVDRQAGERLLEKILSSRNIARAEYMMGMRRNAYLRKIVEHDMHFTDAQVKAEFERAYGARVKVRHIQVAGLAEAERIEKRLAHPGADFAELARDYSANPNTAPAGGRLRVFSREDEDVPALMRTTAFALEAGRHSAPLRVGEWFHILKVEERYPPGEATLQQVRDELEERLRRRLTEPAMQQLHQALLQRAEVEILDPVLAEEFQRGHHRRQ